MTWYFLLLINVLAVHRLAVLIIDDKVTEPARDWFFDRWSPQESWTYLLTCPWCLSMWFGIVAVVGTLWLPVVWIPVALVLAISSAVGILYTAQQRL